MTELHEPLFSSTANGASTPVPETTVPDTVSPPADVPVDEPAGPAPVVTASLPAADTANGTAANDWHAEAGRKGARRLQQLIQEGKLYEQEHGLKRGRQRRRQLLEQGKLYEQEHGLRPQRQEKKARLARGDRDELLVTFLRCLVRLARPSFRPELVRLIEVLRHTGEKDAG